MPRDLSENHIYIMKCALITGGSRGIGRAVCEKLAADTDYHLLINYRSQRAAAEETLQAVTAAGGTGDLLQFDVTDAAAVKASLETWQAEHPEAIIEVIVNNAGITKDNLFLWLSPEDWHTVINTSLTGFYNVTQPLIQSMVRKRYGRIVNIVSVSGVKGQPGQTNYSAAKGGLIAATKALAQEIAKRKITVNAVAPGFIKTDMTGELDEKELKRLIPAGRFGEAEEVADLVSFLVSPKAAYITGEVIKISGGI